MADTPDLQQELVQALLRLAKGDFSVRLARNYTRDTADTLAHFVNLIAEELARLLAERERDHKALVVAVEQLTEQFLAFAAGDFSIRAPRTYKKDPVDVLAFLFNNTASEVEDAFVEIRRQRDLVEAILESMIEGVIVLDHEGRVVRANRSTTRLFGELVGLTLAEVLAPSEHEFASQLVDEVTVQPLVGRETLFRTATGDAILLSLNASAQLDSAGKLTAIVLVARDDRELRQAQARLQMMDRLATMGTVAAGVAHEINNPLAFVLANIEFVERELVASSGQLAADQLDEIRQALNDSRTGSERMRDIVRELKSYARSNPDNIVPLEVARLADASLRMIRNDVRHRARLVVRHANAPRIAANEGRLVQVIINLVQNAAQAIPEGKASQHEIRVATGTTADGEAFVEVRDTGAGIAPEHRAHIFSAFFTTKPGVGTGLGLAICDQIVRSFGGRIEVESEVGVGSTFRVVLPPAERAPVVAQAPTRPTPLPESLRRRVLVVDDEQAIGQSVRRLLAECHVDCVTRGQAALELLQRERYDIVLCDVHMPEMNGPQLYEAVRAIQPELARRFVFMTGGELASGSRAEIERIDRPLVEKPFDSETLRTVFAGIR